jgi:hypothetical protein
MTQEFYVRIHAEPELIQETFPYLFDRAPDVLIILGTEVEAPVEERPSPQLPRPPLQTLVGRYLISRPLSYYTRRRARGRTLQAATLGARPP